jgi:hypothetical protein
MTAPDPAGMTANYGPARAWRRTWVPLALLVVVALGAVLSVLLFSAQPKSNDYLDPASAGPGGAKALAAVLRQRGFQITAAYTAASALADTGPVAGRAGVTLIITSPDLLTSAQRRTLATAKAGLVLVQPGAAALRDLAPQVRLAQASLPLSPEVSPSCALAGARLAGPALAGLTSYLVPGGATGCYPVGGHPTVIRYVAAGRSLTILGTGLPMANAYLGEEGNAALALNLLSAHRRIVWLTPEPVVAAAPPRLPGQTAPALVPAAAWLVVLQLGVALAVAVIWRSRRFGPLIAERLPLVVRAAETVEGHARLYQARRSRDRAAAALREAMLGRVKPALGLPPDASPEAVAGALASRSARPAADVAAIGYGPPPASDLELVKLADELDELEREVRSR